MTTEASNVNPEITTSGRVKWFNNKAGYGFITVASGDNAGDDVFVHHSAIQVSHEQYRYLVQGEYVNFSLCSVDDQSHKWQAGSVKGINDGKLMCETRLESRETRASRGDTDMDSDHVKKTGHRGNMNKDRPDSSHYRIRSRGPGPREGDEWMLVRRRPARSSSDQPVLRSRTSPQ